MCASTSSQYGSYFETLVRMGLTAARRRLAAGGRKRLVVERRRDRLLHHDETVLGSLVAGVAGSGELIEGDREFDTVSAADGTAELGDLTLVERSNDWCSGDPIDGWIEQGQIRKSGLEP